MRGHCHAAEYRFDKAIEDFNRAISIKPDHAYYFISRGRIYYNLKEFGETIEDFKTAIQINPEISCFRYDDVYTPYTSWLNRLCDRKSNYLKRVEKLSKDIRRNQHDASRYFKRGKAYYELGHFDASHYPAALADFNESLQLEPNNENVLVYRGLTLIKLQQYDSAIDAFSRALSLKPDYLSAYKYRGIAYYEKGDYIKAKDDFDRMPLFSGTDKRFLVNIRYYSIMVGLKLDGI